LLEEGQDPIAVTETPTRYLRPRPAHLVLVSWLLALLMVVAPGLASAGGRVAARKSKARPTKLRTLGARNKARTRIAKPRAHRSRGSKLSNRIRMRSQARKQALKAQSASTLGAKMAAKAKAKAKTKLRQVRVAKRKQRMQRIRAARSKAKKAKPGNKKTTRKQARRLARAGKRNKKAKASADDDGGGGLAESTLTNTGTLGLLATGARSIHRAANLNRSLSTVLGVAAPIALAVGSTYAMSRAKTIEDRSDAGHGLLWAAQGGADFAGKSFATLGVGLGVAGGGIQVGVGAYRIWTGIKARNWSRVVTGVLDTTAGTAWALTAVSYALPVTMSVFVGATVVKMLHENRHAIAGGARKLRDRVGSWAKRLRNFGLPGRRAQMQASL
jgi:hypothetical protein